MSRLRKQGDRLSYNSDPIRPVIGLGKNSRRLLSTVHGKKHANDDDHYAETFSTRSLAAEEDIDREPESSSDETFVKTYRSSQDKSPKDAQSQGSQSHDSAKKRKRIEPEVDPLSMWNSGNRPAKYKKPKKYGSDNAIRPSDPVKNIHAKSDASKSQAGKVVEPPKANGKMGFIRPETVPEVSAITGRKSKIKSKFSVPDLQLASSSPATGSAADDGKNDKQKAVSKPRSKIIIPKSFPSQDPMSVILSTDTQATRTKPKFKSPKTADSCSPGLRTPDLTEVLGVSPISRSSRAISISSSISELSDVVEIPNPNPDLIKETISCPVCSRRVTQVLYDTWIAENAITLYRDKKRFCEEHTKCDAKDIWQHRGYPVMKWGDSFDMRLKEYLPVIEDIIHNPEESFFRGQLQGAVDRGESRTVQKRDGEKHRSSVGYYGVTGLRAMSSMISYEYAAKVRTLALTDPIIAARDPSGYIDMVLVPELASRLIMEDMGVDMTRAREIMEESHALGNILYGV